MIAAELISFPIGKPNETTKICQQMIGRLVAPHLPSRPWTLAMRSHSHVMFLSSELAHIPGSTVPAPGAAPANFGHAGRCFQLGSDSHERQKSGVMEPGSMGSSYLAS